MVYRFGEFAEVAVCEEWQYHALVHDRALGDNNVIALGSSFFRKRAMAKARALSEALAFPRDV